MLFSAASGRDEEGGATSGEGVGVNASFQPDGSSNTGSSPASRDLMVVRTRASSSSTVVWVIAAFLAWRQMAESSKAAIQQGGKV